MHASQVSARDVCVRAVIAPYFMMLCITSPDIATQLRNTHVAALLKPG